MIFSRRVSLGLSDEKGEDNDFHQTIESGIHPHPFFSSLSDLHLFKSSTHHAFLLLLEGSNRKKLKELMTDFQLLRQRMMSEYKETVGQRYLTVTGEEANEEMIDKIISDEQGGEEFLLKAIQASHMQEWLCFVL